MKSSYSIFFYIIILLCSLEGHTTPTYIQSIGVRDGLSQPSAISIWQDHTGRMWFGNNTINGYNGYTTKVIRLSEHFPDIEDVNIHHLCGDDSTLFLIAERTVISMNLYTDQLFRVGIKASSIFLDKDYLYAAYKDSVKLFHRPTQTCQTVYVHPGTIIRKIIPANDTQIWVGTNNGLFLVNKQTHRKEASYTEHLSIRSMFQDRDNNLWFGAENGTIWVVTPTGTLQPLPGFNSLAHCFTQDTEGKIWIGTLKGLYKLTWFPQAQPFLPIEVKAVVEKNPITALYIDRQEMLWVGAYYGDIQCMNTGDEKLTIYPCNNQTNDQLHGVSLCSINEDANQNLYIGTRGHGFNIYDKDKSKLRYYDTQNAHLPNNHVCTTYFDESRDRLYVGLERENLIYIDCKTGLTNRLPASGYVLPPGSTVKKILPFKDELVLITQNDGFFRLALQTGKTSPLFTDAALQAKCETNIRTAYIDDKEQLWVSSLEEGFFTIDLPKQRLAHSYGTVQSGFPFIINGICGNSVNGIYMSTLNDGILAFNPGTNDFTQYTRENNQVLLSNHCFNINMSSYGKLIVTTDLGFSVIDISVQKKLDNAFHVHLNDLYPLNGFSSDCDIYVSPSSKNIYLGTLNGIISFNEHIIGRTNNNYNLLFSELKINNNPIRPTSSGPLEKDIAFTHKLTLPYDQNTISLAFSSTNYNPIKYTQYECQLDGLNPLWTKTDNNIITYPSLRPGIYTLTVREADNPQKAISLEIEILRPIWLSSWAILLYLVLTSAIILRIYLFNRSKIRLKSSLEIEKKKKEEIEKINKEKLMFLNQISNELRGPLTIIITMLNSIVADDIASAKRRTHKVIKQAMHLQQLVTQLLDFSMGEQNELNLPKNRQEDTDDIETEVEDEQPADSHYTVLVIDPDTEFRRLIREQFSFAYSVIESDNSDEGYEIAISRKPDTIICEELIQGLSGMEVCKLIKSNIDTLHIPFILLTHQPSDHLRMQMIRSGADNYFIKPFEVNLLLERCNQLINNRRDILNSCGRTQERLQETGLVANTRSHQRFLERNHQIIDSHLSDSDFDTQLWCKELGIGRTSLFSQFKEITGMTPNDYLLQYKIKKAQNWLQEDELSIAEIGYKLGYSDPGYFSRSFKKITGHSPLSFRKKIVTQ